MMFNISSLRGKLYLAFVAILFISTISLSVGLGRMASLNDRLMEIVSQTAPKVWLTKDIQRQLMALRNNEKNVLLSEGQDQLDLAQERGKKLETELESLEGQISQLVVSKEGKASLKIYSEQVERYLAVRHQVIDLAKEAVALSSSGSQVTGVEVNARALRLSQDKGLLPLDAAASALEALSEQNVAWMNASKAAATAEYDSARTVLIGLLILKLSLGLAVAYGLTRTLLGRVQAVTFRSEQIVLGKFDVQEDPAVDELTVISRSHASVMRVMRDLIEQTRQVAQASRTGDLSKRMNTANLKGDWMALGRGINTVIEELLKPGYAQTRLLLEMAEGHLTARITDEFKGDLHRVNQASNQLAKNSQCAINAFDELMASFAAGKLEGRARVDDHLGDWRKIMVGLNSILANVHHAAQEREAQSWVKTGLSGLAQQMLGDLTLTDMAGQIMTYLAHYVDAHVGALYVWSEGERVLHQVGSYAYEQSATVPTRFALGEGLVGQAALQKQAISVTDLPQNFVRVTSGMGAALPKNCLVIPLLYEGKIKGVIELGSLHDFDPLTLEMLHAAGSSVATALNTAEANTRTRTLLQRTQEQAAQLQLQQEELQQSNEELEEQAQNLKLSEERLKAQQIKLQQTNEELEEQTRMLESQSAAVARTNADLEAAKVDLQMQAEALAISSKYKSEFLANMSHELRTPLNAMLILSRSLADNRDGNLNDKQVTAAKVMHQSGNDLLSIINDILDLSKIEAGHEIAEIDDVDLTMVAGQLTALFNTVAEEKGLFFQLEMDAALPSKIRSDRQRLGQILRNLLANAFKFTAQGGVVLKFSLADAHHVAIAVIDSGIGIPQDKQGHVWEAFQQADGSINREFGGTGLGLSISRELAKLLGAKIDLISKTGEGSTFTLCLPIDGPPHEPDQPGAKITEAANDRQRQSGQSRHISHISHLRMPETASRKILAASHSSLHTGVKKTKAVERIADDRATLARDAATILIVEDDPHFAQVLAELCREKSMPFLACPTAEEALELLATYRVVGVLLDMNLPDHEGLLVLNRIKDKLETLHIPVYVISVEERRHQVLHHGAIGFLQKPVSPEQLQEAYTTLHEASGKNIKTVLVVEDDVALRAAVRTLLDADDVSLHEASTGEQALAMMRQSSIDLIILDLGLPDMNGFEFLEQAGVKEGTQLPPVIVFTGRELSREEYEQLQRYSAQVVIKGVRSDERLVNEVALFLHRRVATLPDRAQKMLAMLHDRDALFTGKKVLLVDDDIRNIFSLSGLLEERGFKVITAKNGQDALDKLALHPTLDVLLTDIMMPVMDGYELIRQVRRQERHARLPILALTAKAMKGDRDRCMEAGASDYLSKPVDTDRLLSTLRVWLYR